LQLLFINDEPMNIVSFSFIWKDSWCCPSISCCHYKKITMCYIFFIMFIITSIIYGVFIMFLYHS